MFNKKKKEVEICTANIGSVGCEEITKIRLLQDNISSLIKKRNGIKFVWNASEIFNEQENDILSSIFYKFGLHSYYGYNDENFASGVIISLLQHEHTPSTIKILEKLIVVLNEKKVNQELLKQINIEIKESQDKIDSIKQGLGIK